MSKDASDDEQEVSLDEWTRTFMLDLAREELFVDAPAPSVIVVAQEQLLDAVAFYGSFFEMQNQDAHSACFTLPGNRVLIVETSLDDGLPTSLSIYVKDLPAFLNAMNAVISLDEMSLQLQGDAYYVEQTDPFDVTWQLYWPLEYAPLEKARELANEKGMFIERRLPKMPTRWGHLSDGAALCEEFDVDKYVECWGLPQHEEYNSVRTPSMPQYHWMHLLDDGTMVFFKYDTCKKYCILYVDPGDPSHALAELGLDANEWELNDDDDLHFVHDDKGDTSGEWQVLRQDEFGNSFAAKKDVTEYEARRWVEIYEARGHKQLYWCEEKPPLAGVK